MAYSAATRRGKRKSEARTRKALKWMAPSHSASATVVFSGEYAVPRNTVVPSSARSPAAAPLVRPLVPAPIRIGRRREPRGGDGQREMEAGRSGRGRWGVVEPYERVLVVSARLPRSRLNLIADHDGFAFLPSVRWCRAGLLGACQRNDQRERETAASAACHRQSATATARPVRSDRAQPTVSC